MTSSPGEAEFHCSDAAAQSACDYARVREVEREWTRLPEAENSWAGKDWAGKRYRSLISTILASTPFQELMHKGHRLINRKQVN